jgi:hypothetical protein
VLSVEEVGRLLEVAPGPKYRAALGTAYVLRRAMMNGPTRNRWSFPAYIS